MKVQVFRTSASSYQDSSFTLREQKILESIDGVIYIKNLKDLDSKIPFILITNTHTQINEIPVRILKQTSLIIHPNSGFDNFTNDLFEKYKIPVILGNPIRSHAVAEYVLSSIFKELTPIKNHIHWPQTREWNRKLLRDQVVLILGHGHIGKILTESLTPLTREIRSFDPYVNSDNVHRIWNTDLAQDVDILIIVANANSKNFEMINTEVLNKLSSDCIIINPSRGSLINERELAEYLSCNKSARAYLDVFQQEPYSPGFMLKNQNLTKTPHIAGVFNKLNHDIISFEYIVINDFIQKNSCSDISPFLSDYKECLLDQKKFLSGNN